MKQRAMSNGNYIKLNRKLMDHWIWTKEKFSKGQAWVDLLMMARWKDGKQMHRGKLYERKRGEVNCSMKWLAERWGWNRRTVKLFLTVLESEGMLSVTCTTNDTTITIENYSLYQDKPTEDCTTDCTTDCTHKKKDKKEKKEKKEREEAPRTKNPYGRKKNVWLTDDEYQGIKERYRDYEKLIDHVGDYLANSKPYDDHEALINKIGREDKWIINIRSNTQELSQEEINRMRDEAFGEGWNS